MESASEQIVRLLSTKRVQSIEVIQRVWEKLFLLVFEDGERLACRITKEWDASTLPSAEMMQAPKYFTAEDVARRYASEQQEKERREARDREMKLMEIERLKAELGVE